MRIALDANQQSMRDATAAMLSATCTTTDVRAAWSSDTGISRDRWRQLAKLGLTSVVIPAEFGGLGATELELVPLLEETSYAALPEPLVDAAVAASLLVDAAPTIAARLLPALAAGDVVIAVGLPDMPYVDHAVAADVIMLARDDGLYVIDAARNIGVRQPSIDRARRLARVDPPAGEPLVRDAASIARAIDRFTVYTAAQLLGLGRRCLDLSVAYARERHQFGRPIGSYQALKHRMADDWTALEFARPIVWRAAWALARGLPDATLHVSSAKAVAGDAASTVARTAVQVHGAMGYTFECDVQIFLKRILALSIAHGDARHHRRRLAEVLRTRDIARIP
jgi:alkylation response protein AidB-like acyl-CoA dehydrogenase